RRPPISTLFPYPTLPESSELAEDAVSRFACRNSQTTSKTGPEKNFSSQIARYRKRCFWSRGGYRFPGRCMDKRGCKCRFDHCMGGGWEVHAHQSLARADGC